MKPARIELDFGPAADAPRRRLALVLLALGLGLAAWAGEALRDVLAELGSAEARLALADRVPRADTRRSEPRALDADTLASLKRAAGVADQLGVPWDGLFAALEAADARPLGLLSTQPSARDRSLRIAGEARSIADVLAYVERLSGQPAFTQVYLLGYTSALRDGVPVVVFNLAASWRPRS